MSAPTVEVLEQVRQALDAARQAGEPMPGRPTLTRLTGATDHAVRKALAILAEADAEAGDHMAEADESVPPAVHQPSPALTTGHQATAPAGGRLVAWAGFIFGSLTSVAANVLAARITPEHAAAGWHPSVYAEVGAAVWPVALLLSVEGLSRVRWPKSALWNLARFGGAGTVALGSALISYSHIAAVLAFWGYSALGAHVGPLVIDGLMTISGFALLATAGGRVGGTGDQPGELTTPAPAISRDLDGDQR